MGKEFVIRLVALILGVWFFLEAFDGTREFGGLVLLLSWGALFIYLATDIIVDVFEMGWLYEVKVRSGSPGLGLSRRE